MYIERSPSDLVVTTKDFTNCGWQNILTDRTEASYEPLWQAFSTAATHAIKAKLPGQGKALWLLADACAMRLLPSPEDSKKPFASAITHWGWQTIGPDDLTEADLEFFARVASDTTNLWLKVRLTDLLWVRKHSKKGGNHITLAVLENYQKIPLSADIWQKDGKTCWTRVVTLATMLGKGAARDKLLSIEQSLLTALVEVSKPNGWWAWHLADLLMQGKLAKNKAADIANKLKSLAREYDTDTDQVLVMTARTLFRRAEAWFNVAGEKNEAVAMRVQVAECYVREGMSRINTPHPSYVAAASFYGNAIQTYRTIPHKQRQAHGVDERITELQKQIDEFGKEAWGALAEIPYPQIDFREQMEWASQAVQNKTLAEALQTFSCIVPLSTFRYQDLRRQVLAQLKQPSLMHMLPVSVHAENWRKIAQVPGLDTNVDPADETNNAYVFWKMTEMYFDWLNIDINVFILPALDSLLLEHCLQETDLIELVSRSPIVPSGRKRLFGKALLAGFNRDFATALHLLVPQVEHMVRYHLKQAGANTTHLHENSVQTENGLSSLVDLPEMEKVFGVDLAFEIKALFCSANGPNLRNQVAHGLLNDNDCQSIEVIYAWWLGLQMVCYLL